MRNLIKPLVSLLGGFGSVARASAVLGLATAALFACGCFPPPPKPEVAAEMRKIADPFVDAMKAGDLEEARKHTSFTSDEKLKEYLPEFEGAEVEHDDTWHMGSTLGMGTRYQLRYPGGSRQFLTLTLQPGDDQRVGRGWEHYRITEVHLSGRETPKPEGQ